MNLYGVFILGVSIKYGFLFLWAVKWPVPVKGLKERGIVKSGGAPLFRFKTNSVTLPTSYVYSTLLRHMRALRTSLHQWEGRDETLS